MNESLDSATNTNEPTLNELADLAGRIWPHDVISIKGVLAIKGKNWDDISLYVNSELQLRMKCEHALFALRSALLGLLTKTREERQKDVPYDVTTVDYESAPYNVVEANALLTYHQEAWSDGFSVGKIAAQNEEDDRRHDRFLETRENMRRIYRRVEELKKQEREKRQ